MQYFYKLVFFICSLFIVKCHADIEIKLINQPEKFIIKVFKYELVFCGGVSKTFVVSNQDELFKIDTGILPNTCLREIRVSFNYRKKLINNLEQKEGIIDETMVIGFYGKNIPVSKIDKIAIDMQNHLISPSAILGGVSYSEIKNNDYITKMYNILCGYSHSCTYSCIKLPEVLLEL